MINGLRKALKTKAAKTDVNLHFKINNPEANIMHVQS